MSQMQLLVGASLPWLFYTAPVAAIAAIGLGLVMRDDKGEMGNRTTLSRGIAGAGVGIAVTILGRILGGSTTLAGALSIGAATGSVLAVVALWLISRATATGSTKAAGLVAAGLATLEVSLWVWVLSSMGERLGVPDGDWARLTCVLVGSSIGSALVALSVSSSAPASVARNMDAFATTRAVLVAAAAIGACAAYGFDELAEGERRLLAMRLVVSVLGVAGAGALASVVVAKTFNRETVAGAIIAGIGAFGVLWFGLRDEAAVSAMNLALIGVAGCAAGALAGWRKNVGFGCLAAAGVVGWWLARSDESDAMGLFGVALVGVGFVSSVATRFADVKTSKDGAAPVSNRLALASTALAGLLLLAVLPQVARVQQTLVGAALGRAYPSTNYRNGTFIGKVDIAAPHGVYTGHGMFALIFPGAGPEHSTIYDAGMIDRSRLQEHVLESLKIGMVFPLAAPGADDHGHDDHAGHDHDHAHDDGGHDHDPTAARTRVLEMTGQVAHGDHSHSYTQDLIASRHARLTDVLAFHGGSLTDPRLIAGLFAGLALAAFVAGTRLGGVLRMIVVVVAAGVVTVALGLGAACGLVAGATLAAVGCGISADSERSAALCSAVKGVALTAIVLIAVVIRHGAMLG